MEKKFEPEFSSWNCYADFARRVRHERRYIHSDQVSLFLSTVAATSHKREIAIEPNRILFRAQRGIDWIENNERHSEEPIGYNEHRMKPLPNRATEGRANSSGIPVLYLASTLQTAVSEVRPWIGADVSVAQFRTNRQLRAIALTQGHGKSSFEVIGLRHLYGDADAETKERAVWTDIDSAFSRPVTVSDNAADYVPTQILAELFRHQGFDAIVYRSQFGDDGYNVALFDVGSADVVRCAPYTVTRVEIAVNQIGNDWYKSTS